MNKSRSRAGPREKRLGDTQTQPRNTQLRETAAGGGNRGGLSDVGLHFLSENGHWPGRIVG